MSNIITCLLELTISVQVANISAHCDRPRRSDLPRSFQVTLNSSDRFTSKDNDLGIKGRIVSDHGQMIQGLLDEPSLSLEVFCSVNDGTAPKNTGRVFLQHPCMLSITVYGPLEQFNDIGSWFQDYELYLQDPIQLGELDVRYCNPHRLSSDDLASCPLLSDFITQTSTLVGFEELVSQPDVLDILSSHADLEEAPQPTAIRASLKR